jgi:hypothetical protein
MPELTSNVRPRRRERSRDGAHRADEGDMPQRIARIRSEVFEIVGELQRIEARVSGSELARAGDRMQSIANQLGSAQASISSVDP